ncbi:MAG TPA: FoF1 ATP synthase subunit gamma [Stellaceae bacterium]|nr:FoF1 ATP synthase subunit gamma [Stellaceae bacterium]
MTRLAEIEGHISSMSELLDIVGAMRSLAAIRVQEAQRALPGIRQYAETMMRAIRAALLLMPQPVPEPRGFDGRSALILCAAEHGFVGCFNERLIETAEAALAPGDAFYVLGSHGGALAVDRGRQAVWTGPMATRLSGTPQTIRHLESALYRSIANGEIARVAIVFARYRKGGSHTIERHQLLPLDLPSIASSPPLQSPLHNLPPRVLVEKLMAEYVFARLAEAAVESIASENAARFSAMESAHDNVAKKLNQLDGEAHQARQSEITAEILDLITGTEAMVSR